MTAPPDPRYPAELVCTITTRDDTALCLRPIRSDDAPLLIEFHNSLSSRSVYRRFFFVHPTLSPAEVERFTCVDYVGRLALVVEHDHRLIAVGRYEGSPETAEAEVAFVVADQHQHHGIATVLLEHLARAGWDRGITTFVASALAENREMLDVFAHSGYRVVTDVDHGVVSVRFSIEPSEGPERSDAPPLGTRRPPPGADRARRGSAA